MTVTRVIGEFRLDWGESLCWDDRRARLYFVDCARQTLHWLDDAEPPLHTMRMPSMPTGVVLTEAGSLVVALDDGLHVVDVDRGGVWLLAPYPAELAGRANDACADADGNLLTGTLNLAPGPGSIWQYSSQDGWRKLDDGTGNTNGPVVVDEAGSKTLVVADTVAARIYAYPYDGQRGRVGERRVLVDVADYGGAPDGACGDADGGVWSCVLGGGRIVRHSLVGEQPTVLDPEVAMPADVAFGGPGLDRLFVVSIAVGLVGEPDPAPRAGALLVIEDIGRVGLPEPRFRL